MDDNVRTGIYLINAPAAVQNNVVLNASSAALELPNGATVDYNDWGLAPVFSLNGNALSFGQWLGLGGHSHDIAVDPQWVNANAGDFSLAAGSACIGSGIFVGLSYNGVAPDMGAVESP